MWLVAKFKKNELSIFKENLKIRLKSDLIFYQPKFLKETFKNNKKNIKEIPLIGSYIFVFHSNFTQKNVINFLSSTKGLEYFLDGSFLGQSQIDKFISLCKSFEDKKGHVQPNFFKNFLNYKARFLSGPFANKVFEVIEKKENYIKIILNNFEIKLSDKSKYLYRPV